ncbi:MAG TPA: DUF1272 domain-containing protein [Aeromonadales bacterium]|nr:DUF1272 domain-containing protein [Aeromonadales bacterium]
MLEIRPNCELCDIDLPADSLEAFICSYECTFCRSCVDTILHNICPNCGGGFSPRPVRPKKEFRKGVSLLHQPASVKRKHSKYSKEQIEQFIKKISE